MAENVPAPMSPHTDAGALLKLADRLRNFAVWNARQSHYEPVPLCREAAEAIEAVVRQAASQGSAGGERSEVRTTGLPEIPDDDADFSPDMARKIISTYQQIIYDLTDGITGTLQKDEIERLRGAAQAPWQLIETAHHKDGTRILGWDGKQQFTCFYRGEHHKPHQDKPGWFDQHIRMHPTHWQPLGASPPVPSADGGPAA